MVWDSGHPGRDRTRDPVGAEHLLDQRRVARGRPEHDDHLVERHPRGGDPEHLGGDELDLRTLAAGLEQRDGDRGPLPGGPSRRPLACQPFVEEARLEGRLGGRPLGRCRLVASGGLVLEQAPLQPVQQLARRRLVVVGRRGERRRRGRRSA